jgi:hypothetical protein
VRAIFGPFSWSGLMFSPCSLCVCDSPPHIKFRKHEPTVTGYGSATNNNGFWIGWFDLLTVGLTISWNRWSIHFTNHWNMLHSCSRSPLYSLYFLYSSVLLQILQLKIQLSYWTELNWTEFQLLFAYRYVDSGRTSLKTRVTCQNACILARCLAFGMAQTT